MCARSSRPQGQPTRGKTALNRLRRIDVFVALAMPAMLRGGSPLVVDLGFGARPWTTLELAERWRQVNPSLRVLGVEIDRERVDEALPYADAPAVDFALGGFDLASALASEKARVVRCMNVLRQYDESEVERSLALIAQAIEPGGVLLEGTTDPTGRMVAFDVYRNEASGLRHEALVFGTNFRAVTEPAEFRTIAPKRLIHRMLHARPAAFFADWEGVFSATRASAEPGTSRHWALSAERLRDEGGWSLDPRRGLLERGFLVLHSELL